MGAPLPHGDALNRSAAGWTGRSTALVDPEIILKITPAIDPIDGSAVPAYPLLQHVTNADQQSLACGFPNLARLQQRVNSRLIERFVSIDIPQSSQKALV